MKLIKVDYEILPAVFDPIEAMAEGAPLVHEDWPRNISVEIHQEFGNVDEAFRSAFHVRKDKFIGHRTYHYPIEPHACVAMWENGKVTSTPPTTHLTISSTTWPDSMISI